MYYLYAFSKQGHFQDCGPIRGGTALTTARLIAQQELDRLNASKDEGDEWGVEIMQAGRRKARVGWRRTYPVE